MYQEQKWKGCRLCNLCQGRHKVVQLRGPLPTDVLFVGEAPGFAEDVFGIPFISTAGDILNHIIKIIHEQYQVGMTITNMVCCIPKDEKNPGKVRQPSEEEIYACSDRLASLIVEADPSLIVCVGETASKYLGEYIDLDGRETCNIPHPIGIVRSPKENHAWMIHDAASTVITALDIVSNVIEMDYVDAFPDM